MRLGRFELSTSCFGGTRYPQKRYAIFDSETNGLGLAIYPSGQKTFFHLRKVLDWIDLGGHNLSDICGPRRREGLGTTFGTRRLVLKSSALVCGDIEAWARSYLEVWLLM